MTKELDKEACRLLAEILHEDNISLFKDKTIDQIAEEIPRFKELGSKEEENGALSRNFGGLTIMMYDLENAQVKQTYERDLKHANSIKFPRGDFIYGLMKSGKINNGIGFLIMGNYGKDKKG